MTTQTFRINDRVYVEIGEQTFTGSVVDEDYSQGAQAYAVEFGGGGVEWYNAADLHPARPAVHPLNALGAAERRALVTRIDLALGGEQGWAPAIAFAENLTTTLVGQGRITAGQAAAIIDYTRSF